MYAIDDEAMHLSANACLSCGGDLYAFCFGLAQHSSKKYPSAHQFGLSFGQSMTDSPSLLSP